MFLCDLGLEAAHLLLLLLAALVALEAAAPAVVVAALELLLAGLHLVGLAGGQGLQLLIILGQVHVAALAGVDHLLLRHAGGGPADVLLRGALGLAPLLGRRLGRLGLLAVGRGRAPLGGRALPGRRGSGGRGLGRLRGLGLVVDVGVDALHALHLVVLGQIVKDDGQLLLLQNLHMVLGGLGVFGQDISHVVGLHAKVLGHLVYTVFIQQMCHLHKARAVDACTNRKTQAHAFHGLPLPCGTRRVSCAFLLEQAAAPITDTFYVFKPHTRRYLSFHAGLSGPGGSFPLIFTLPLRAMRACAPGAAVSGRFPFPPSFFPPVPLSLGGGAQGLCLPSFRFLS